MNRNEQKGYQVISQKKGYQKKSILAYVFAICNQITFFWNEIYLSERSINYPIMFYTGHIRKEEGKKVIWLLFKKSQYWLMFLQ